MESGSGKQLQIGQGVALLPLGGGSVASVANLVEDLFPVIADGIRVRPALHSEDLRLISAGLIELMKVRNENGSGSRCVQLIRRILRRV